MIATPKVVKKYEHLKQFKSLTESFRTKLERFVLVLVTDPKNQKWQNVFKPQPENCNSVPSLEDVVTLQFVVERYFPPQFQASLPPENKQQLERVSIISDSLLLDQPEHNVRVEWTLPDLIPVKNVADNISDLATQITSLPSGPWKVDVPGRFLITCAPVIGKKKTKKETENAYLFVCNDILLYCKQNQTSSSLPFTFSRAYRFSELKVYRSSTKGPDAQIFNISKYVGDAKDELLIYTLSERDCKRWINHIKTAQSKYLKSRKPFAKRFTVTQNTGEASQPSDIVLVLDKEAGSITKMEQKTEKLIASYDISKLLYCSQEEEGILLFNFLSSEKSQLLGEHCFQVETKSAGELEREVSRMREWREGIMSSANSLNKYSSSNVESVKNRSIRNSTRKKKGKASKSNSSLKKKGKTSVFGSLSVNTETDIFDFATDSQLKSALEETYTSATTEFSTEKRREKRGEERRREKRGEEKREKRGKERREKRGEERREKRGKTSIKGIKERRKKGRREVEKEAVDSEVSIDPRELRVVSDPSIKKKSRRNKVYREEKGRIGSEDLVTEDSSQVEERRRKSRRPKLKKREGNSVFFVPESVEVTEDNATSLIEGEVENSTEELLEEHYRSNLRRKEDIQILRKENEMLRKLLRKTAAAEQRRRTVKKNPKLIKKILSSGNPIIILSGGLSDEDI